MASANPNPTGKKVKVKIDPHIIIVDIRDPIGIVVGVRRKMTSPNSNPTGKNVNVKVVDDVNKPKPNVLEVT